MLFRIIVTMALAAGLASAQRGVGALNGRADDVGDSLGGMPPGRPQGPYDRLFDKLKLSKEQREEATKILTAANEQAAPTRELLTKGRMVLANHLTGNGTPEDYKKLLGQFATIDATMVGIEADAFGKICALLKPNQQAKAAPAFELMAGLFSGARPGPGMGMGGPGMGGPGMGRGGR
jgi:hypothetical protein